MTALSDNERPGYVATEEEERLAAELRRQMVFFRTTEAPGTIVVHTQERFLYLVQGNNRAIRYGVGVGREGFQWTGLEAHRPQAGMARLEAAARDDRAPALPAALHGRRPGNPMGARALYLGGTVYRIHGTNQPQTIGTAVSSGCFRLINPELIDLYERVPVGTKVVVRQARRSSSVRASIRACITGGNSCRSCQSGGGTALAVGVLLGSIAVSGGAAAQTLKAVKERGAVVCGVSQGMSGFSDKSDDGRVERLRRGFLPRARGRDLQ